MSRSLPTVLLLAGAALAVVACDPTADDPPREGSSGIDSPTAQDPAGAPAEVSHTPQLDDVASVAWTTCETELYTAPYPAAWVEVTGEDGAPCVALHPEEPSDLDPTELAIRFEVADSSLEEAVAGPTGNERDRRPLRVDRREAFLVERRADGSGDLPAGATDLRYLIALDDERTLQVRTSDVGDTDLELDRQVMAHVVQRLTIHP